MDINIIWDNEELEVIEELNEIFNLQEGETMKKTIYNIKNERGNIVANQFLSIEGTDYTFISYQTSIAVLKAGSATLFINKSVFDYSRTTTRHFLNYLENILTSEKPTRTTVENWIKSGCIPASENCYDTDIDIKLVNEEEF